jgi:hypothetical protein
MITATISQHDRHVIFNTLVAHLPSDKVIIDIMTPVHMFSISIDSKVKGGYILDSNDSTGKHPFATLEELVAFVDKMEITAIDIISQHVPNVLLHQFDNVTSVYTDLWLERSGQSISNITKIEGDYLNTYSPSGYLMSKIPIIPVADDVKKTNNETSVIKHGIEELYFVLPVTKMDWCSLKPSNQLTSVRTAYWLNNVSVSKEQYIKHLAKEIDRAANLLPELGLLISKYS